MCSAARNWEEVDWDYGMQPTGDTPVHHLQRLKSVIRSIGTTTLFALASHVVNDVAGSFSGRMSLWSAW